MWDFNNKYRLPSSTATNFNYRNRPDTDDAQSGRVRNLSTQFLEQ